MDTGATIPPAQVPVSAVSGNLVQNFSDGLYVGTRNPLGSTTTFYVNNSGADAVGRGTQAAPFQTLDYALTTAAQQYPASQFVGNVTICLQAGQTFTLVNDFNVYTGGVLQIAFYGDPQYGDLNTAYGTANAQVMSDLARPIITPQVASVNGSYWKMAGFNRFGGSINLIGVQVNLPAAPANPSITLYSQFADLIRSLEYDAHGYINLRGAIVNVTDTTAFWGILGISARSTGTTLTQFASQFWVNGRALSATATPTPTTAELAARQYFVKFYPEFAGNNQTVSVLSGSSTTTSPGSGVFGLTWSDTPSLLVQNGKTNLGSFPVIFDITYGFRNYVFNLQRDQQQRPLNIVSSRLM